MQNPASLTRYPLGSFRELLKIATPLVLVLASGSLMNFLDRLILARYSLESLEVCTAAANLGAVFQFPLMRLAIMTQVLVGHYQGACQFRLLGQTIWQMIWFFLMTMIVTVPLGWVIGPRFFANSPVAEAGIKYFHYLMAINFLFPLGATLAAFYLGRGKTKMVMWVTLASQVTHIGLDFPLIFGIKGILHSLGALGSVIATTIAELGFCVFLFFDFTKKSNRISFGTESWRLRWTALRPSLQLGVPRMIAMGAGFIGWAAAAQIMVEKGGEHLAVLALGGSFLTLFACIHTGLLQSVSILAANLIGAKSPFSILMLFKPAFLLLMLCSAFFAIPCLLYPNQCVGLFFKGEISHHLALVLRYTCIWIWLYFIAYGIFAIFNGLSNACGDVMFQMIYQICVSSWANYLPAFLGIAKWGWRADSLWLSMTVGTLTATLFYFWRLKSKLQLHQIIAQTGDTLLEDSA